MLRAAIVGCLTYAFLHAVGPVSAQTKLAGTFQIGQCEDRPGWSSFATLVDTEDFHAAADCSRRTGHRWVLFLTGSPYQPITAHALAVRTRIEAAGLRPYLLGVVDHEEWYENVLSGAWAFWTQDPAVVVPVVHAWTSARNAEIRAVFPGLPILWITTLVNDSQAAGLWLWRPLPVGVSAIALEGYVPKGRTWAQTAGVYLAHALATRPEPIVLVTQGFRIPGDPLWDVGPTGFTETAAALQHPRVIASWLFAWDGDLWAQWAAIVGLKQRPDWQAQYVEALGVRE